MQAKYECVRLTLLLADALVLDDVLVIELLQDPDLLPQVVVLLLSVLGLQGLDGHHLPGPVSAGIIAAQLHPAEVTLHTHTHTHTHTHLH